MSGRSIQPPWTNSPSLGGEFIYQSSTDQIVLKSGRRYQRPQSLPVNSLRTASYDGPLSFDYTGTVDYTLEPGRSRAFSAPESPDIRPLLPLLPASTPRHLPQSFGRSVVPKTPVSAPGRTTKNLDANREPEQKGPAQLPRDSKGTIVYFTKQSGQRQRGEPANRPDASARKIPINNDAFLSQVFPTFVARKRSLDDVGKLLLIIRSGSTQGSSLAPTFVQGQRFFGAEDTLFVPADRYVIIHPGSPSDPEFVALPITTYGGRGVAAPGVIKSHHCIIFSSTYAPAPMVQEDPARGTDGMRRPPIRVNLYNPMDSLDPMQRVRLMDPTPISNHERIMEIGRVSRESKVDLMCHFWNVWGRDRDLPRLPTSIMPLPRPPLPRLPLPGSPPPRPPLPRLPLPGPPPPRPSSSRQPAARVVREGNDDDNEDD